MDWSDIVARLGTVRSLLEQVRSGTFLKSVTNPQLSVHYEGFNGGDPVSGVFVEVDEDTWVENGLFTFEEVSETWREVVLLDASRGLRVTMDLVREEMHLAWATGTANWEITEVEREYGGGWFV